MNPAPSPADRWTPRRWGWTIAWMFAGQVLWVFLWGGRTEPIPLRAGSPTAFQWRAGVINDADWGQALALADPTLFALVSPQGFSGPAWRRFPQTFPPVNEWREPPRWLPARIERLGEAYLETVPKRLEPMPVVLEKPLPDPAELLLPPLTAPTQSWVRVEGELAARWLGEPLRLPAQPHSDLLSNSVVQVTVLPDGRTFSAVLLGGCGRRDVDQDALKLAGEVRFAPQLEPPTSEPGTPRLAWGRLIFPWCARATNPPAAGPEKL